MTNTITPRIYVACLAAYNNGQLHGEWIDASADLGAMQDAVNAILATSPIPKAEEYAIHDSEYLGNIGEYAGLVDVAARAELIEEHGELAIGAIDYFGSVEDAADALENKFIGEYKDQEIFAIEWTEMTGEKIPESVSYYIDYDHMGRDLLMDGFYAIETDAGIAVFTH